MAVSASKITSPYQDICKAIDQTRKEIEENFNPRQAVEDLEGIYKKGLQIFKSVYVDRKPYEGIPLTPTMQIFDILCLERFQCDNILKYAAAKTLRIFLQLTLITTQIAKQNIPAALHQKVVHNLLVIQDTVRIEEVRTAYEVKCCFATALVLNDVTIFAKTIVEDNIEDVLSAIGNLAPGDLAKPIVRSLKDVYHLHKISWFSDLVFEFQLRSHLFFLANSALQNNDIMLEAFYDAHQKKIEKFDNSSETAFCVLQDLIELMEKAISGKKTQVQTAILGSAKNSDNKPTLRKFVNLKSYWEVHYLAIDYLMGLSQRKEIPDAIWKESLNIINEGRKSLEDKHVGKLFLRHFIAMKKESEFKSRVDYLKSLMVSKKDKSTLEKLIKEEGEKIATVNEQILGIRTSVNDQLTKPKQQAGGGKNPEQELTQLLVTAEQHAITLVSYEIENALID